MKIALSSVVNLLITKTETATHEMLTEIGVFKKNTETDQSKNAAAVRSELGLITIIIENAIKIIARTSAGKRCAGEPKRTPNETAMHLPPFLSPKKGEYACPKTGASNTGINKALLESTNFEAA